MTARKLACCPGCGARVPDEGRATHPYYDASPGCWATYGSVLAREYTDARYASVHRLTVDSYAVQHPGVEERRTIQSVAVHLIGLQLVLERSLTSAHVVQLLRIAADRSGQYHWLVPPAADPACTVVEVSRAGIRDPVAHVHAVRAWASHAWRTWQPHHAQVRHWALELEGRDVAAHSP
ncbi:MAG: hypothetical protein JWO05_3637 [Gemmatimonadetes bacterium]|nr:hypothetical protein [Gemmatimonadota bacterium]